MCKTSTHRTRLNHNTDQYAPYVIPTMCKNLLSILTIDSIQNYTHFSDADYFQPHCIGKQQVIFRREDLTTPGWSAAITLLFANNVTAVPDTKDDIFLPCSTSCVS